MSLGESVRDVADLDHVRIGGSLAAVVVAAQRRVGAVTPAATTVASRPGRSPGRKIAAPVRRAAGRSSPAATRAPAHRRHRRRRSRRPPPGTTSRMEPSFRPGNQANDEGTDRECHEVARRRPAIVQAGCTSGEDGHAGRPDCQVGEDGASAPSRAPNSRPQSMTPSVCSVTEHCFRTDRTGPADSVPRRGR